MNPQELDGLLAAHFAGTLDAEGQKQLADALLADEAARRRFVELSDQEAALRTMMEARQLPVPGSWFLVPGSGNQERGAENGGPQPRSPVAEFGSRPPLSQPGTRNQPLDNIARGPEPVEGEPGTAHHRRAWLFPALAAAALIVVSFLFASGILPSGSVTIKEFGNTTDRVVEEKLSDGTRLAIAPGAKLFAKGRDEARRVRQLIKLESGEVEVMAPKAAAGEVACRVETPEGLWVETIGTTFRVTHAWENEKGELNVDNSKLTGAAIAAVLLVAVSDGEVRTGTAVAEEARVAAGGDTVVKAAEASKAEEAISWGQAVSDGLRLGISPGKVVLAGQQSFKLTLWWENTGKEAVAAPVFKPYGDSNLTGLQLIGKKGSETFSLEAAKAISAMLRSQMPGSRTLKAGERFSEELEIPFGKSALYQPPTLAEGESLTLHLQVDRGLKLDPPKAQPSVTGGDITVTGVAKAAEKISWGQVAGGLQGRIEAEKATVAPGEDIKLTFWLRTDEQQKDSLHVWDNAYSNGYRNDSYLVKMPDGKIVTLRRPVEDAWRKNAPTPVELKPGVPWKLYTSWAGQGSVRSLRVLGLDTSKPGTYTITGVYAEAAEAKARLGFGPNAREVAIWGGKLTTPPIEVKIEPAKAEGKVSWGQAVGGLQAGLSGKQAKFEAGKPMSFTPLYRNTGKAPLVFYRCQSLTPLPRDKAWDSEELYDWRVIFRPKAGGVSYVPIWEVRQYKDMNSGFEDFLPGEQRSFSVVVGAHGFIPVKDKALELERHTKPIDAAPAPLPPGAYLVTASFNGHGGGQDKDAPANFWRGPTTTGPVEIEVVAAGGAGEQPSWGEAVNGLQGRIEAVKSTVRPGEDIQLTFWLRADEKLKESLYVWDNKYSKGYRNDSYLVTTPSGLDVWLHAPAQDAWDKNSPHPVELKPGVPAKLEGWTGSLKSFKAMGLDTAKGYAGRFTITGSYEEEAGDAGNQGFAQYKGIRIWGGRLSTPRIEVTVEKPKPEEKVSWGQAVDGLKAGLATKETQFETGKPIELLVHVKNIGWAPQVLKEADSADSSAWKCVFKRLDALGEYNPDSRLISPSRAKDVALGPGESRRLNQTYDRPWRWIWSQADSRIDDFLPAGTYSVTAKFAHGAMTLTTGALEIEIVAPAEAAAAPTFSAKPQRPADKVAAEVSDGALVLTVTSPGGIGSAEIKPEKGAWPKKVTVRLALKGLEGFSAECGGKKVSSRLGAAGGKDELVAERKGEFIEVALPEGFASGKDAVLKIGWVDFYR